MVRRINFYGGAGCGKSTMAARVFADLKMRGFNAELVPEEIKLLAYQKRFPKSFKQLGIFADQLEAEDDFLEHVDVIVSDSPIHMNVAYSKHYGFECWPELLAMADKYEAKFPSANFWCHRKHPYNPIGRYNSEDNAKMMDNVIRDMIAHLPNLYLDDLPYDELIVRVQQEIQK